MQRKEDAVIRPLEDMPRVVRRILADVEIEVVELKEAKSRFSTDELGRYFSALSNEANLRNLECGWLLFGVSNDRTLCGTNFCKEATVPSVGLRRLKHAVADNTNGRLSFDEIYELEMEGKRVVAFQVPPATFATPTTWKGTPWAREHESLVQMPNYKLNAILSQNRPDWSGRYVFDAAIGDLDPEAVAFARERFEAQYGVSQPAVKDLSQTEALEKMGLVVHGRITNAALVLLGKPEASALLGGSAPRITWTLYNSAEEVEAYEHFDPPFILQVDRVLGKIRNERYRYFDSETTLFPTLANKYDPEVIRELLHNAIAHQDYRQSCKINILEYEDRLAFKNEGAFIPGSIEEAIRSGYRPPYYRNRLLTDAMCKIGMVDQNAIGIRSVFNIQRKRMLPLPTYDLSDHDRVTVTVYGRVIDEAYTRLLASCPELDLDTVFLLDMVQKHKPVTKEQARVLRRRGLVEGRYPRLIVSSETADIIGAHDDYVRLKGLDKSVCKELILELLRSRACSRAEILAAIEHALPESMDAVQREKHVGYLLQELRREGRIVSEGKGVAARWHIAEYG